MTREAGTAADRIAQAAERLRDVLQHAPTDAGDLPRAWAHSLLDAALDLASTIRASDGAVPINQPMASAADYARTMATDAARILAHAAAGWIAPVADWHRLAETYPRLWRRKVAKCLADDAPLPRIAAIHLAEALRSLDSEGAVPESPDPHDEGKLIRHAWVAKLLTPLPPAKGYGKQPMRKAWATRHLLVWIEAEAARSGRPKHTVQMEVADALRKDIKTLERYLAEWRKKSGPASVAATLTAARTLWSGGEVAPPWPPEVLALVHAWDAGIGPLVAAFHEASEHRARESKPRNRSVRNARTPRGT